jgi:hypothetical protein
MFLLYRCFCSLPFSAFDCLSIVQLSVLFAQCTHRYQIYSLAFRQLTIRVYTLHVVSNCMWVALLLFEFWYETKPCPKFQRFAMRITDQECKSRGILGMQQFRVGTNENSIQLLFKQSWTRRRKDVLGNVVGLSEPNVQM